MELQAVAVGGKVVVEGTPGVHLLAAPGDITEVIGACFEQGSRLALLYAENLTPAFFDLSSGEAGEILQKLRNYHIRLAVVLDPAKTRPSSRFPEMAVEERRAGHFAIFANAESARAWLTGGEC